MTLYQSEQNLPRWFYDDLMQIGADLFCCTPTSWLPVRSPRTASIVSCTTCPVSHFFRCQVAQPMFRFTIQILHQGFTRCRGQTNLCTTLLFADWRPLHCWRPEDTSDWSSADPYSRASTYLKKLITSLRDILQGRYTTDPCHYCITSVAAMHYCYQHTSGTLTKASCTCAWRTVYMPALSCLSA